MKKEELMKLGKEEIIVLLLAIIERQAAEIAELKRQLNQNSRNSSKPPSSDGYKRPSPKSLRKPSGKSVGGQKYHIGSGLSMPGEPDEIVKYEPAECAICPDRTVCTAKNVVCDTRYEIDVQIETKTTAHQKMSVCCPGGKEALTGIFPEHIKGRLQYGVNLEALAIALNTVGMVSVNRTHEILSGEFGVPISTGTIAGMVSDCALSVAPSVEIIKEAIKSEPLIHSDETGVDVDKTTAWAHVACTDKLTHIDVQEKRGQVGIDAIGILVAYMGTLVHDCFAPYFHYALRHGLCVAHLLRELAGIADNYGQSWAQSMIDLLVAMKRTKEKLAAAGRTGASPYYIRKYSRMYDKITVAALQENPVMVREPGQRGRIKRGKPGALADRLVLHKDKYMLFFVDFTVPFDNNQAERDIRMFKVKLKVSGCFRTMRGAKEFAAISSYVNTARKHGLCAFHAIKGALVGMPLIFSGAVTE